MTEALKARLVQVDGMRSQDALVGVGEAAYQPFAERATVGPYHNGRLESKEVRGFLSDPNQALVIGCGRNEHQRGNLVPNLEYGLASTDGAGNYLYVDANSTDGSAEAASSLGVSVVRRKDVFNPHVVDTKRLAEILAVERETLEGKEGNGDPPLRKGIDILVARIVLLRMYLAGALPQYTIYTDTDLKSIPGGLVVSRLEPNQVYHPLQLIASGALELNANGNLENGSRVWAVLTGSGDRNNEPIFFTYDQFKAEATSPFRDDRQREIADAFAVFPSTIVHPLTGELLASSAFELTSMNATGQCIESARTLSLTGGLLEAYGTVNPDTLREAFPLAGNVRRGTQQRIDEPQPPKKEWWMIGEVLCSFIRAAVTYAIEQRKLPHQFDLDDYTRLNYWLKRMTTGSQLDNDRQTRQFDQFPMERAIPPVLLLYKEGLLKI